MIRRLWLTGDDPHARTGNQNHLWDEQEIESRTGGHGKRQIRRGKRKAMKRRGKR